MRMKQLTFFFRVGSGVTTNFRISHHCFLCVCCPTLWMPTFLAQLQEDLRLANARSIPRMPMPTRMTRSEDPKIFEVANDMSVRWWFANKKNKVIVKRGSTFDLEDAHPSKKTSGEKQTKTKHLTWVSRWFFGIQHVNSNPTQVPGEAGQGYLSQWIDVIIFTIPQDLAQKIHAGKLITVVICIIDLSIATPEF